MKTDEDEKKSTKNPRKELKAEKRSSSSRGGRLMQDRKSWESLVQRKRM